jgi:hypothetical protein
MGQAVPRYGVTEFTRNGIYLEQFWGKDLLDRTVHLLIISVLNLRITVYSCIFILSSIHSQFLLKRAIGETKEVSLLALLL